MLSIFYNLNLGGLYSFLGVPFLIFIFIPLWLRYKNSIVFKTRQEQFKIIKYFFEDEFVTVTTDGVDSKLNWKIFHKVKQDSNFVLFYQNKHITNLIPKRFFDSQSKIDDFVEILKERIVQSKN